jgi:hypothetical protein
MPEGMEPAPGDAQALADRVQNVPTHTVPGGSLRVRRGGNYSMPKRAELFLARSLLAEILILVSALSICS